MKAVLVTLAVVLWVLACKSPTAPVLPYCAYEVVTWAFPDGTARTDTIPLAGKGCRLNTGPFP